MDSEKPAITHGNKLISPLGKPMTNGKASGLTMVGGPLTILIPLLNGRPGKKLMADGKKLLKTHPWM